MSYARHKKCSINSVVGRLWDQKIRAVMSAGVEDEGHRCKPKWQLWRIFWSNRPKAGRISIHICGLNDQERLSLKWWRYWDQCHWDSTQKKWACPQLPTPQWQLIWILECVQNSLHYMGFEFWLFEIAQKIVAKFPMWIAITTFAMRHQQKKVAPWWLSIDH